MEEELDKREEKSKKKVRKSIGKPSFSYPSLLAQATEREEKKKKKEIECMNKLARIEKEEREKRDEADVRYLEGIQERENRNNSDSDSVVSYELEDDINFSESDELEVVKDLAVAKDELENTRDNLELAYEEVDRLAEELEAEKDKRRKLKARKERQCCKIYNTFPIERLPSVGINKKEFQKSKTAYRRAFSKVIDNYWNKHVKPIKPEGERRIIKKKEKAKIIILKNIPKTREEIQIQNPHLSMVEVEDVAQTYGLDRESQKKNKSYNEIEKEYELERAITFSDEE